MAKVIDIEGIGTVYAGKLNEVGIDTTDDLLRMAGPASGRRTLAAESGIDERQLLEWVNRADLMRVKGVGEEYSDLLEAAGVDSPTELANRNAANLHATMAELNAAKKLVRREPSLGEVERWIADAKTLDKVVTH
jgi:predicted flap endonuclease-1-like 5' DNA nuclease